MVQCSRRRLQLLLTIIPYCFAYESLGLGVHRSKGNRRMNLKFAARRAIVGRERQHETDTRLHGRWLLLARIAWFVLVLSQRSIEKKKEGAYP
jgi:hypothetical protein